MTKRMTRAGLLAGVSLACLIAAGPAADAAEARYFEPIATFPVFANLPAGIDPKTETVAEIVAVTEDGLTLVTSDSPGEAIGLIDITDPAVPEALGRIAVGGEPTSVVVVGATALVGVNTAESYTDPSGHLAVVPLDAGHVTETCDVGGQPDSVALSPDRRFVAVAIENERDEDLNDGVIPQLPAGHLAVFTLGSDGVPTNCDAVTIVDLSGLAAVAGDDPEPEYVDINADNQAVVTLQENNHIVIVDLPSARVVADFSAGAVDLAAIDTERDGVIAGTGALEGLAREPDAVSWIDAQRLVTANEGDYEGGSRGFTVFGLDGSVAFDSAEAMEHLAMAIGHYPEKRAGKKGVEPEGVEVGVFGDDTLIFVNSERGNFVAVYRDNGPGLSPTFIQVLPTNVGPEGTVAIPSRDLFVVATEVDEADEKLRSTVQIFARTATAPAYPQLVSEIDEATGAPIGWGALSGLVADPSDPAIVYAVNDSFYKASNIYTIDVSASPARITGAVTLTRNGEPVSYDLEGIATRPDGGFWLVSEGHVKRGRANLLLQVAADGRVVTEIGLPEVVLAQMINNGFEGVASTVADGVETVVVAFQRPWKDDPEDHTKIGFYRPADNLWSFAHYPMSPPVSSNGGWVGLSEITHLGGSRFAVIERDNQPGVYAAFKVVTLIDTATVTPRPATETLDVLAKTEALDLLTEMSASNGWVSDKPEGLAVTADGRVWLVIDNDGVDDAPGETQFLELGTAAELF